MNKKIIILLSAKRCGSTAIFNLFQKHDDVKILHSNQNIINWEPQFWTYAIKAISGKVEEFNDRIQNTLGIDKCFLKKKYYAKCIFTIFDRILDKFGPIIFDKSPQYLGSEEAMRLLIKYKNSRPMNQFVFFSFIRNPLDAITSQHELWSHYTQEKSLSARENSWLKKYNHLENLQKIINIKLYKYEEYCQNPKKYTKDLMNYCGLRYSDKLSSHLVSKSVGRYYVTPYKSIKKWKFKKELENHMKKYGYSKVNNDISFKDKTTLFMTSFKRMLVPIYEKFFK